jgi:hypothetical protein
MDSGSASWLEALQDRAVWSRALRWGAPVGLLQAVINQGDFWMNHAVDGAVLAKTIISPLVTISVALISAAGMHVEKRTEQNGKHEI